MPEIDHTRAHYRCWICNASKLTHVKAANIAVGLSSEDFRITNSDYGRTGDIYRCDACGFYQCSDMEDVLSFYEEMEDPDYEATRVQRALQEAALLRKIGQHKKTGNRLLDVGAGSGILVEEALKLGFQAEGVEPSRSLQAVAADRGLPVHLGILPNDDVSGPFDVVTIVDVIEHVPNPIEVLETVRSVMAKDGLAAVVTPDRGSMASRLMGYKWWHYRMAHIGYFDRSTLALALRQAGLEPVAFSRPGWYFPASYLFERVVHYFPFAKGIKAPTSWDNIVVPLNLRDSLLALCKAS